MKLNAVDRAELLGAWEEHAGEIRSRLKNFSSIPPQRYMYELFFCIMTPQSSAAQCALVADELERLKFLENGVDPTPLLRGFGGGYVRFHNTKARRLLALRALADEVLALLNLDMSDKELRNKLAGSINGLGMKEASHFLRNIGRTGVCIVDRHILRNMLRLGFLDEWPRSISQRRYLDIEQKFEELAHELGIDADELDLLLWRRETGFILK